MRAATVPGRHLGYLRGGRPNALPTPGGGHPSGPRSAGGLPGFTQLGLSTSPRGYVPGLATVRVARRRRAAVGLIIGLLVLWLVLAVVGFVVKSLFWLAIVAIVLYLGTAALGAVRRRRAMR